MTLQQIKKEIMEELRERAYTPSGYEGVDYKVIDLEEAEAMISQIATKVANATYEAVKPHWTYKAEFNKCLEEMTERWEDFKK